MVPSGFHKGFITSVLQRFGSRTLRKFVDFTDDEIVEMLDVLADDLKHQRPSAYVLTERISDKSQRCVSLKSEWVDDSPSIRLFSGTDEMQWGVFPFQFGARIGNGGIALMSTSGLVSFLRQNRYDPYRVYAAMVDSAVSVVSAKVVDYTERVSSLHAMLANVRIHQARSVILSQLAAEARSANAKL